MSNITGEATFQNSVRQLEPTDPGHASTFNPVNQVLINNDVFFKGRSDNTGLLGDGYLPYAGSVEYTYDGQNRISTATYKDGTEVTMATVSVDYDDTNGGRINYVQAVIVGPPAQTIRKTYQYDADNQITGITRTVT